MRMRSLVLTAFAGASFILVSFSPTIADDAKPRGTRPPEAEKEKGQRDLDGQGAEPQGPRRFGEGPLAGRDPAQFVTMMMRQFDKDGDQKLNSQELTALLTSMRDRRAQMGVQPPMGPLQGNRLRPGGMEARRGGDGSDDVGGVTPKRPPVEE